MFTLFFAAVSLSTLQPSDGTEYAAGIALAQQRGERLYRYDRVAWVGSDAALQEISSNQDGLRGYVVTPRDDLLTITFFGQSDGNDHYHAVWRTDYRGEERVGGGLIARESPAATLTDDEQAAIAARARGIEALFDDPEKNGIFLCSQSRPNITALPVLGSDGDYLVYLMTPQRSLRSWPNGGHARVTVMADGSTEGLRSFTKSCMELGAENEDGGAPVAFYTTHILDKIPTEIHMFTALASKIPIYVMTSNETTWRVDASGISLTSGPASED